MSSIPQQTDRSMIYSKGAITRLCFVGCLLQPQREPSLSAAADGWMDQRFSGTPFGCRVEVNHESDPGRSDVCHWVLSSWLGWQQSNQAKTHTRLQDRSIELDNDVAISREWESASSLEPSQERYSTSLIHWKNRNGLCHDLLIRKIFHEKNLRNIGWCASTTFWCCVVWAPSRQPLFLLPTLDDLLLLLPVLVKEWQWHEIFWSIHRYFMMYLIMSIHFVMPFSPRPFWHLPMVVLLWMR